MKRLFSLILVISTVSLFSQKIEYFPQEQIIISPCVNAQNNADCTYDFLEKKVSKFLKENKKGFRKLKNDTLQLGGSLIIDKDGTIDSGKSAFGIRVKKINKNLEKEFNNLFQNIEIVNVINRKPFPLTSRHTLNFKYVVKNITEDISFELISLSKPYTGGIINEIPRFPGCENLNEAEARICFQTKMQNHIRYHFRYPQEAQNEKISGRVSIIFEISKEGKVTNIRTRGPHPILEKEAIRIINFLPDMIPGKQNGEPVKVPYSIPITFKI